jgi:hypothetical protein
MDHTIHCAACYQTLSDPCGCVHQERYRRAEAYIKERVAVCYGGSEALAWKGAYASITPGILPAICVWSDAYLIYGWDMMTSILIHECGHYEAVQVEGGLSGIEGEHKVRI